MDIDFTWLENEVFLVSLNDTERQTLTGTLQPTRFDVGDDLIAQGARDQGMFIIRDGRASVFARHGRKRSHLGWAEPGDVVGSLSFFGGYPATATVMAEEPTLAYGMDREGYCRMLVGHQELLAGFLTYLHRSVARMLHATNRRAFLSPGGDAATE